MDIPYSLHKRRSNVAAIAVLLLTGLTLQLQAEGSMVADIQANRTLGVAPLAVHLIGHGSSNSDLSTSIHDLHSFHEFHYTWDFGDPNAGNYSTNGLPKNKATGPIAGHVYETPGVYTVTMTVTDPFGQQDTETIEITVEDPDVVFAGANTVCISNTNDFSGAPVGATLVNVTNSELIATVDAHMGAGKRILLNRGETWYVAGNTRIDAAGPGILGAYGQGARPRIENSSGSAVIDTWWVSGAMGPDDWRIMDLHLISTIVSTPETRPGNAISLAGNPRDILVFRVKSEFNAVGVRSEGGGTRDGVVGNAFRTYVVDSEFSGHRNSNARGDRGGYGFLGPQRNSLILGNRVTDHTNAEHCFRTSDGVDLVVAHNIFTDPWDPKHALTLRGPDWNPADPQFTERVVISNNYMRSGGWTVTIHPTNGTKDARIRDVLFERNFISGGTEGNVLLTINAQDITVRNNIFGEWQRKGKGVSVYKRGVEPDPERVRIYNNTFHVSFEDTQILELRDNPAEIYFGNNLVISDLAYTMIDDQTTGTALTYESNIGVDTSQVANPSLTVYEDYRPAAGSSAIDSGVAPLIYEDFFGTARPLGLGVDIGAVEWTQPNAYASWSGGVTWEGLDSSPAADPNGDGVSNLLAYALDLDPLTTASGAQIPSARIIENNGRTYLAFEGRQNLLAPDLTYHLLGSETLEPGSWIRILPETSSFEVVDDDVDGDGSARLVRYTFDTEAFEKYFLRWEINLQ